MSNKYSKVEVFRVFRLKDIELMRSLINKEIMKNLGFAEHEKAKITRDLNVPLVDIIDEPDDFHGYNFKPLYYNLFGDEYVRALLELVGEDFKGFEYHYMWIWNLNKYSLPILKTKLQGSLSELQFNDRNEFCLIVSTIGGYFGSTELLHFLNNTNHFDIFYTMTPCENEAIVYLLEVALVQVALAIIEHIKSSDIDDENAAKTLHQKLMDLLREYFMEEGRINNAEVIYFLLNYIDKRNQLFLLSSTIKSIPQRILDEFLGNPQMRNLNEIIKKALK
ncbi:MAG: hypothetical protein KAW51_07595 [Candidatus Lokiarchaeota archaeon]|nr:hypothetical protein [Candidatus Lokiarchaeota archaeon]